MSAGEGGQGPVAFQFRVAEPMHDTEDGNQQFVLCEAVTGERKSEMVLGSDRAGDLWRAQQVLTFRRPIPPAIRVPEEDLPIEFIFTPLGTFRLVAPGETFTETVDRDPCGAAAPFETT